MSHKLNSAVAVIGVEIGKDSFDVAGQDKRDEMHSEASSSSQPSIITRDQGRRGRPRVPSVTAIRKVCSIPEGDDKSGVVQCKISAEPVSVVGSNPEVTLRTRMSASTGCGHCRKTTNAFGLFV